MRNDSDARALRYRELASEIASTVIDKQAAYGDSFGRSGAVMALLYPQGIPPEQMDDALTVVRVLDKLFRIATDRDALGESPWRDIAGYALLSVERVERERAEAAANKAKTCRTTEPCTPTRVPISLEALRGLGARSAGATAPGDTGDEVR